MNESKEEFSKTPEGQVRRWLLEIQLADKREEDWRKKVKDIWARYRAESVKKNSFNILYSNTETLASAVYNAPPSPDVRRRFRDADPAGKVVAQVLERSLEFSIDTDQFAATIGADVLDMLLPGRGISRVKYLPKFVPLAGTEAVASSQLEETPLSRMNDAAPDTETEPATNQPGKGYGESPDVADSEDQEPAEELAWEQVVLEHVQWDKFRHGPGKKWEEVEWIAFEHSMNREELAAKFGEAGEDLPLDEASDDDIKEEADVSEVFRTAQVYEVWDKAGRQVLFISKGSRDAPLKVIADPLRLTNFYPVPRPLMALADSDSLLPIPLYVQYEEQARELDLVSSRISKIIDACKLRGIYDSTMSELSELLKGNDNDLIPAQDAAKWIQAGGIEKAIWMMPIDQAARVLQILHAQRDATKQVIYEITGIADVMRGASNPNETLGAQQLKARWGGQRINRLQLEVQRYGRDQLRIMAEVIAERFQPETLLRMTGMQIPSQMEVQMAMQQIQMQAQQRAMIAQQQGQPPPPPPSMPPPPAQLPPVTLEQVMELLRDDAQRSFKVDVETDSMIGGAQQQDMQELQQLLQGITGFIAGIGPAVQQGALPIEAVKEIVMSITRRARMGSAVEDALDKMQAPPAPVPAADPHAAQAAQAQAQAAADTQKAQLQSQLEQAKFAAQQQLEQAKLQNHAQLEAARAQADQAVQAARMQADQQIEATRAQATIEVEKAKLASRFQLDEAQRNHAFALKQLEHERNAGLDAQRLEFERWKAGLDAATRIQVAEIAAGTVVSPDQRQAAQP
ncbi:MAG: hypothetical protein HY255_08925 [Betaproteobacteria bacterium]|nr:hypothetical protein [Betaproteobacteria bacterium]